MDKKLYALNNIRKYIEKEYPNGCDFESQKVKRTIISIEIECEAALSSSEGKE